jgi:uncharacterized membrane protein YeaQ/YmgE (transglycosylase-associated protein family)
MAEFLPRLNCLALKPLTVVFQNEGSHMNFIWTIIIGFVAGVIAKFLHPGPNEPAGFILTTLLGIAGAFVATYLGQALGLYRVDQGAGLIGAVVGAFIVLWFGECLPSERWSSQVCATAAHNRAAEN